MKRDNGLEKTGKIFANASNEETYSGVRANGANITGAENVHGWAPHWLCLSPKNCILLKPLDVPRKPHARLSIVHKDPEANYCITYHHRIDSSGLYCLENNPLGWEGVPGVGLGHPLEHLCQKTPLEGMREHLRLQFFQQKKTWNCRHYLCSQYYHILIFSINVLCTKPQW